MVCARCNVRPVKMGKLKLCLSCYMSLRYSSGLLGVTHFKPCLVCQEMAPIYARQRCRPCYQYERFHGCDRRSLRRRYYKRPSRFCPICLCFFKGTSRDQKLCSHECANIFRRLKSQNGIYRRCSRCERYRLVRCRLMCAPCYVVVRFELHKLNVERCPVRVDVFKGSYAVP